MKPNIMNTFKSALIVSMLVLLAMQPITVFAQNAADQSPQQRSSPIGPGVSGGSGSGGVSAGGSGNGGVPTLKNPLSQKIDSLGGLVQTFIEVLSYILILFGVLMLVWTGLQFILAQGNSDKLKELRKQLVAVIIGIALVIGARVIIQVIINTLKATGAVDSRTIQSVNNAVSGH